MKKRIMYIIAVLLCTFTFTTVKAELVECEITDEFKWYMKLSEEEKRNYLQPEMCKSNGLADYNLKNIQTENKDDRVSNIGGIEFGQASSYPSYYKATSTPVRHQKLTPTCWAYAATTILESHIIKQYNTTYTFSPQHLNYFESQSFTDYSPNPFGSIRTVNNGGTFDDAASYYMNHYGPVFESTVPTNNSVETLPNISASGIIGQKNVLEVNSVEHVIRSEAGNCTSAEKDKIKSLIYKYGPTGASMMHVSSYVSSNGAYIYKSSSGKTNHKVTIVGWDDNYAVSNFSNNPWHPQNPGAWIIQNSHGTSSGLNGFLYVSYEDSLICREIFSIRDADFHSEENSYVSAQLPARTFVSEVPASMVVNHKLTSNDELLSKVSFRTTGPTSYSVYYYPGNAAANNVRVSGMKLIASGSADYAGWVTAIPTSSLTIPSSVSTYSITVVQYSHVLPFENKTYEFDDEGVHYVVDSKEYFQRGVSYVMQNGKWVDLYDAFSGYTMKAPINVFTYDAYIDIASANVNYSYQDYFNVVVKATAQKAGKITKVRLVRNGTTIVETSPNQSVSAGSTYTYTLKKSGLSNFTNGTYQVEVVQSNGVISRKNITINVLPITSVEIKNTTNKVYLGKTFNMKLQAYPVGHNSTNPTITWTSSNTNVATVNASGVVTGKALGRATITARTTNGYTASYEIVVIKPITDLSINPSYLDMVKGGTRTIVATVLPADTTESKTLRWESSDPKVATVDNQGVVKALKPGRTTIKVVTVNGISKTVAVTVYGVLLNKTNATLDINKTIQLTANVINNNKPKTATWSSSNTKVATVNSSGLVTAKGEGTATITAKDYAGRGASATIKVTKIPASKFTVTEISVKTYNGKEQKPAPVVKYNGKVLKAGTDYTVVYSNNKKPGKATVTIKANPNSKIYGGAKTVYFIIKPKGTTLQKLTTKSKTVRVYWAKHPYITDYHIQYRVKGSSTWKNLYVSGPADSPGYYHDITGLTKGKYYQVRVRAKKNVDKKDYYGAYSTIKTIKCK